MRLFCKFINYDAFHTDPVICRGNWEINLQFNRNHKYIRPTKYKIFISHRKIIIVYEIFNDIVLLFYDNCISFEVSTGMILITKPTFLSHDVDKDIELTIPE